MTVSIVIAVKAWQNNLAQCLTACCKLDYPDFEIIVLPDGAIGDGSLQQEDNVAENRPRLRIIPTGPVNPARKRDLAIKEARGEIIAFIDDDAYPAADWLKNALKNFQVAEVAAVGGPSVTPAEDNFRQKASGEIYASFLVSANFIYRYLPGKRQEVDDFPSCNFLVRKSIMQLLGGFNTDFWPGEDTKLCLQITKKLKQKIIYDPEVLVYHHRREIFLPHLKQIANYALHRGYFVKRFPQTSLRIAYFIPSLFLLGLISGALLWAFLPPAKWLYLSAVALYLILVLLSSLRSFKLSGVVFPGIVLTHLTYGVYFLKGLFIKQLAEENR